MKLDRKSRNFTTFMISIGLLRMITSPMRAINSVAQFVRVIIKILGNHIRIDRTKSFLNDIEIKRPKINYNNEKTKSKIKRFVLKHIIGLNEILANIERIDCTASALKSQFCMLEFRIIKYVTDAKGRHFDMTKIAKIIDGSEFIDAINAKIFIGVCVYYRIGIKNFAIITELIYRLFKKKTEFRGEQKQLRFMIKLKLTFIITSALIIINYFENAEKIIFAVNASLFEKGAVLMQLIEKKNILRDMSLKCEVRLNKNTMQSNENVKKFSKFSKSFVINCMKCISYGKSMQMC